MVGKGMGRPPWSLQVVKHGASCPARPRQTHPEGVPLWLVTALLTTHRHRYRRLSQQRGAIKVRKGEGGAEESNPTKVNPPEEQGMTRMRYSPPACRFRPRLLAGAGGLWRGAPDASSASASPSPAAAPAMVNVASAGSPMPCCSSGTSNTDHKNEGPERTLMGHGGVLRCGVPVDGIGEGVH